METTTSVKGVIQDSSGRPVSNATVMIVDGTHSFNDMASVTSDEGVFYLSNIIVPGEYTILVNGQNKQTQKKLQVQKGDSVIHVIL